MQTKDMFTPASLSEQAVKFVAMVANLTMDGEEIDGEPWDMPSDDAVDTIHSLINRARELRAAIAAATGE